MTRVELVANLKRAAANGTPAEVVDPATGEVFYLVSAEQFLTISTAKSRKLGPRLGYPFVDRVMANDDVNDSLLDSYQ